MKLLDEVKLVVKTQEIIRSLWIGEHPEASLDQLSILDEQLDISTGFMLIALVDPLRKKWEMEWA